MKLQVDRKTAGSAGRAHIDLRPCPFCGENTIFLNPREGASRGSINCPACLVVMPEEAGQSELIRSWNERTSLWQHIGTAPKDGTRILLFTTHVADDYCDETFSEIQIGCWDPGHLSDDPMWSREAGWDLQKIGVPSHWMPLPKAPEQAGAA